MAGPFWNSESMGDRPEKDDSAASQQREDKPNHGQRARKKDEIVNSHDTREVMPTRRCQKDNVLMEPVGVVGRTAAHYCGTCSTVQIKAI